MKTLRKEEGEAGKSYLIGHAEYPEMEEQLQSEFRELRRKGLKITSVVIYYLWSKSVDRKKDLNFARLPI